MSGSTHGWLTSTCKMMSATGIILHLHKRERIAAILIVEGVGDRHFTTVLDDTDVVLVAACPFPRGAVEAVEQAIGPEAHGRCRKALVLRACVLLERLALLLRQD